MPDRRTIGRDGRHVRRGLGFTVLAEFTDHDGFDGVILGHPHHPYHLEFTSQPGHHVGPAPTKDHLLVFYIPDADEWEESIGLYNEPQGAFLPSIVN